MVDWQSQPDRARIYLIPLGRHIARPEGFSLGGGVHTFLAARIIIQSEGKRIVDEIIQICDLEGVKQQLPEKLSDQLNTYIVNLNRPRKQMPLEGLERPLMFEKPLIMAVLNVTPDSFSDGGKFIDTDKAVAHARSMRAAGADIIDIGGESTRPGAKPVWEGDEKQRVLPVIEALRADNIPLSLDSRHSTVMEAGLQAGVHIINDVSALSYDLDSIKVVAASTAPVILMHAQGDPQVMQDNPSYNDVLFDVFDYLETRVEVCVAAGIERSRIILDPGIGFGKRVVQDNLALINNLAIFHTLGCPLLLGVSRKRFIGALTHVEEAEDRVMGSVAAGLACLNHGAQILRVHDIRETVQAVKLLQGLNDAAMMDMISY